MDVNEGCWCGLSKLSCSRISVIPSRVMTYDNEEGLPSNPCKHTRCSFAAKCKQQRSVTFICALCGPISNLCGQWCMSLCSHTTFGGSQSNESDGRKCSILFSKVQAQFSTAFSNQKGRHNSVQHTLLKRASKIQ